MALWFPTSEAELAAALADGMLVENHYHEVKLLVGDSPSARKETARDLASFAIDGGLIVVGVHEDKQAGTFSPAPLDLAGQAERIEQIGLMAVDPPLPTRVTSLPSSGTTGYLLVEIPASPVAPHMTDGRYWGRNDKTKYPLDDPTVLRLHAARRAEMRTIEEALEVEVRRDPVGTSRQRAHLYAVALPVVTRDDQLLSVFCKPDHQVRTTLGPVLAAASQAHLVGQFSPHPNMCTTFERRAGGCAFSTGELPGRRRAPGSSEEQMLDVELREDGSIRIFCGRASGAEDEGAPLIVDGLIAGLARTLAELAGEVGSLSAYNGAWDFGLAVAGMGGAKSGHLTRGGRHPLAAPIYNASEYRRTTRASSLEIADGRGPIAERLVGSLLRSLGSAEACHLPLT